jgi:phosphoribosylformylglycinamidine synthase subunit PurSL
MTISRRFNLRGSSDMNSDISQPGQMVYRFVIRPVSKNDPRSAGYLNDAQALGFSAVEQIHCQDLFFVTGNLRDDEVEQLCAQLLSDPLTQRASWSRLDAKSSQGALADETGQAVEVALHPGVTDPVAEQIVRAAHVMGIQGLAQASTGLRFLVSGKNLDTPALNLLASRLLANPTIQRYCVGQIEPIFAQAAEASGKVGEILIAAMSEKELLALSNERRAALDREEMLAIQRYYQTEQRPMRDVEFETIAQTWSEHCVHKTFKALITIQNPGDGDSNQYRHEALVDDLLKTYLRSATDQINASWVRSAFVDNAGIIDFDAENEISFKVETHNHPSAIEPFGGANTGVGGVIRDVIGVSARPIAATDVLCFGPADTKIDDLPTGVLHPRRIRSGVVAGVQDYGNKIGLPTVSGAILYDSGFTANPLVFCGCVGIAPKGSHPRDPQPGDAVIVLGGRTGRDGLRGATFSSMTMDAQTGEVAGASVQIGAPIVEKGLIDVVMQARDARLYSAITDCGAGGLSSAVGEMSSKIGADVDLKAVRLKYPGLAPWEIWLSEAQERMVLAVPQEHLPAVQVLCDTYAVELTNIGQFTASGRLVVRYNGAVVLDLANDFLHDGIPQRRLKAVLPAPTREIPFEVPESADWGQLLLGLLAHPNIASKANVIRIYDHEVQGGTVVKPLTGAQDDGPSDAVVLKPTDTRGTTSLVLGAGINPEYGKCSPYRMAWSVVDEAVRNAVAVGADPARIALLDNFCWGDPRNPATLGTLVEAARGCCDAAIHYGTPFISGKDSLNNEYMGKDGQRHAIPPTLLISSIGVMDDLTRAVTMDLKQVGNPVYLLGDFHPHFEGSHFALLSGKRFYDGIPEVPTGAPQLYQRLHGAICAGLVRACHDLSEGGLASAAAEMCIGGRLGMEIDLGGLNSGKVALDLFGETNGCLLVEVDKARAAEFACQMSGLPLKRLGQVTVEGNLRIGNAGLEVLSLAVEDLVTAWQTEN